MFYTSWKAHVATCAHILLANCKVYPPLHGILHWGNNSKINSSSCSPDCQTRLVRARVRQTWRLAPPTTPQTHARVFLVLWVYFYGTVSNNFRSAHMDTWHLHLPISCAIRSHPRLWLLAQYYSHHVSELCDSVRDWDWKSLDYENQL